MRSFIGNSVGGGLESFTNVTASFYTVFRTLAGDQAGLSHLQKSTHLLNGVYYGLVGAGKEFFDGIAGIIKKPRRGWMLGRGRGLIKGIGNGITGLIVFPINAALRLVTSITKGTANTAKWIHKGTVFSMRRKRNPRNFGQKGILENYDS